MERRVATQPPGQRRTVAQRGQLALAHELTVAQRSNGRVFSTLDLPFLTPAYAITIHRAQGSEWPHVIVVLSEDHELLLTRQLAYTAVTRAKESLIACGSRQAWGWAAETPTPPKHSRLLDLLRA